MAVFLLSRERDQDDEQNIMDHRSRQSGKAHMAEE
jgi:hypothetical protein